MNSTLRANRSKIILFTGFLTLYLVDSSSSGQRDKKRPHIVIIVADDLGWNDVSFHGSNQIPTPNIDALAYNGVILNRHYVQPTCTPSRAALLTGKYPISYGLQGTPIHACEAIGLSMDEKILPQGSFTGKDARRGFKRAGNEMADQYVTDVFTEEARKVIKSCKPQENPMFLMISHLAVHTGNPGPNLLDVSNKTNNDKRFDYIENNYRRLYAGMLTSLDDSVGAIIESLDENGMLEDSIVLFLSDNGAPTEDPLWGYANFGSNWPLRGEKTSVLDGAVRGVAAIWSRWLKGKHTVSENLFHLTDWLPTLYTAAGGDVKNLGKINGVDQWNSLTNTTKQMRSTILINIDEIRGEEALISNQWKVVKSNRTSKLAFALAYSGDRGNVGPDYDMSNVIRSVAGSRLSRINRLACKEEDCADTTSTARDLFYRVRSQAKIEDKCAERVSDPHPGERYECFDGYCLFDLHDDPCEYRNLAGQKREILNAAIAVLDGYRKEMTRQNRLACDPNADPKRHDGYWDNWMESCNHRRN